MKQQTKGATFNIPDQDLKTIITDPNGTQKLVEQAERLGKHLKELGLSTSQIRSLFGEVRQIQEEWRRALYEPQSGEQARQAAIRRLTLLKPKMAYRVGKETSEKRQEAIKTLVDVLTPAIELVLKARARTKEEYESKAFPLGAISDTQDDNFQRFVEFLEAILAYHKAYGGE
jgi:CRISPR-associated protein Csm2